MEYPNLEEEEAMKRTFLVLSMLLIAALLISACGTAATEEPAAPEEPAVPEEPAEPEEPAPEEPMAFECTDTIGCVDYAPGDPIRIASALVISGPNIDLGTDSQYGVEIAIDFQGELMGHPVELQAEDDGCSAEGGQTAGQKIVSDPTILAVVGTSCSGAGVPMAEVISEAGYVMVSPSNTSPTLTDPDIAWQPGYLRTAHNDNFQGAAMADFAYNELGLRSAAAIHDGDPYTESLSRVFYESFQGLGGEGVLFTAVNKGDTDMRPVLTAVSAAGPPELLYYPVFTAEGGFLTKQAREVAGLEDTVLSAADGMISDAAIDAVGEAGEGMYFSGPDTSFSGDLYDRFLERYIEKVGSAPISVFHGHAFDAANMIFACVEEVGVLDEDGTLHIGRQDMRDCLYATENFAGVTGNLTCDQYGDCADVRIVVKQLQDGVYVPVWP
jgi:branched-chain amino acid transport system substrate-binding protein